MRSSIWVRGAYRSLVVSVLSAVLAATLPMTPASAAVRTLSISDSQVIESNGALSAIFSVTLTQATGKTVTVRYATSQGSATEGADYQATSGSLSFSVQTSGGGGPTTRTVAVPVAGDTRDENDETFSVILSDPTNATIADGEGIGTIFDDDAPPTVDAFDASLLEGNSGSSTATFSVVLSDASEKLIRVSYTTSDGTAKDGVDYTSVSGDLTFAPGERVKEVAVGILGDLVDEDTETFALSISQGSNVFIADGDAVGSILDDDPVPTLAIESLFIGEGTAPNARSASLTVSLSPPSGRRVAVSYQAVEGSAASGSDFAPVSGRLTFEPGETSKEVIVSLIGDSMDEDDEQLSVVLSAADAASIADGSGDLTILDDDLPPVISAEDVTLAEGNSGLKLMDVRISLSGPSGKTVGVNYSTRDGSARFDKDYIASMSSVTLLPGETSTVVRLGILSDQSDEEDESFFVDLSNPTNATISDPEAVMTLLDDDAQPGLLISDASIVEGTGASVTLNLVVGVSIPSGKTISVRYATSSGTAAVGTDFETTAGTLTIPAEAESATVPVAILGDLMDEHDESFTLTLSSPVNASLDDPSGLGTIVDDDAAPSLSIADLSVLEVDAGTSDADLVLVLSEVSGKPVSVDVNTSNGTALAPADYVPASGTATIPAGERSGSFTLTINGDVIDEPNETFQVDLSSPVNAILGDPQAIVTILDSDPLPAIAISDASVTEGSSTSFTISLSRPSAVPVSLSYESLPGTASETDFNAVSGSLVFAPGEVSRDLLVGSVSDNLDEDDETFQVRIHSASSATIEDGDGTGTILDNDAVPGASIGDVSIQEGDSGYAVATFEIRLSAPSGRQVTIGFETRDGTAQADSDYTHTAGSVTFSAGSISRSVDVPVAGDTQGEHDETFLLTLNVGLTASLIRDDGIGTILNDDAALILTAGSPFTVVHGLEGDTPANGSLPFLITLSPPQVDVVTVDFQAVGGTTTAGLDHVPAAGTAEFLPGSSLYPFNVTLNGDLLEEGPESLRVVLSNALGADVLVGEAAATIVDDDPKEMICAPHLGCDANTFEGQPAVIVVQVVSPSELAFPAELIGTDVTARSGLDYAPRSATVVPPSAQLGIFFVATIDDAFCELPEMFLWRAEVPAYMRSSARGTVTISDNDGPPSCLPG